MLKGEERSDGEQSQRSDIIADKESEIEQYKIPAYLHVIKGKVGGKVPVEEYVKIRKSSVKNPGADSIMFGSYTKGGPDSYIAKAGDSSTYFDMGDQWTVVQDKYNLSSDEMFDYFNKPVIDDAIASGKTIQFSHNPLNYPDTFLYEEWKYIKKQLNLTDNSLNEMGDFWYVK